MGVGNISLWCRLRRPLFGVCRAVALAIGPLVLSVLAGEFASFNGCVLHEGFKNPCFVCGIDLGGLLYQMHVLGWCVLFTIPIGLWLLAGSVVQLLQEIVLHFSSKRHG